MSGKEPIRAGKLVVEAIRNLKIRTGFTPREVINYIDYNYGANTQLKKCAVAALKRGAEYGILREDQGRYALKTSHTLPLLTAFHRAKDSTVDFEIRDACGCGHRSRRKRSRRRRSISRRRRGRSLCKRRSRRRRSNRRRSQRRKRAATRRCGRKGRKSGHSRRKRSRSRRRRAKCRC